jgi:hypothetical protein
VSAEFNTTLISFIQNVIGQIILIGGSIVGAVKYLENRQNKKIDEIVEKQLTPFKADVCSRLGELKSHLETQQKINDLQLEYIQKAIDSLGVKKDG